LSCGQKKNHSGSCVGITDKSAHEKHKLSTLRNFLKNQKLINQISAILFDHLFIQIIVFLSSFTTSL
jgi:hypothetical protein